MSEEKRARFDVIEAAAISFAGYHMLLVCGWIAGVASYAGPFDWTNFPDLVFVIVPPIALVLYGLGISRELHRRNEWGRRWFTRFPAVEAGLLAGFCAARDASRIPANVAPLILAWGAISCVAFVGKICFAYRMSAPPARNEFR
jgi:hypothetical protein